MLKQEVLLYFICFCNRGVQGGAGARNGWGEGDCLSGWRDLFIPLDHRGDDLDAGLPKILLKDPPHPAPHSPPAWLRRTLGGCTKKPSDFSRTAPPSLPPRGSGRMCSRVRGSEPLRASRPASASSLPLQSRAGLAPFQCCVFN